MRGRPPTALLWWFLLVVLCGCAGSAAGSTPGRPRSPSGTSGAPGAGAALAAGPGPRPSYTVEAGPPPGSCRYSYERGKPLPDPACTPGAVNPEVTQASIGRTICSRGYTSRIRPPRTVTDREKRRSARAYGYTGAFATAEYDHLVPLGVGGDPNDPRNLWLEPNDLPDATTNANSKDDVEDRLHEAVCAGRVGLTSAQRAIAANWVSALDVLGLSP
jgi:hypothetical protein